MFSYEGRIEIHRPPSEVFALLTDLNRAAEWQSGVSSTRLITEGPLRLGSRFDEAIKVGPFKVTARCEVTRYEPDKVLGFTADARFIWYEGSFELQSGTDGGAVLIDRGETRLKNVFRILEPMLKSEVRKENAGEMARIKSAVEAK